MVYIINGETPFQILSSSFSIGPSQTGYELQVGADSKTFSTLFSVGANTPRMVTNVANGSYFRLKNNVGDVKVNWQRVCVDEGGADGTELQPIDYFPLNAVEGTVISYTGSSSASGVYQYDGSEWVAVGVDDLSAYWTSAQTKDYVDTAVSGIDLSNYYTKAETDSAITAVEDHIYDVEKVTASALTELHNDILELSGATPSTEEIELPIAAAVNDLKGNIEARLDQQYYTKQEINDIAARKVEAGQVDVQIKDYVDPAIAEVNDTIEDKELPVSAAINDLNTNKVSGVGITKIQEISQADYDALTVKDPTTLYIIK